MVELVLYGLQAGRISHLLGTTFAVFLHWKLPAEKWRVSAN
jgi:hypothetical protein